jgi:outer membrane lipoprotein LolB
MIKNIVVGITYLLVILLAGCVQPPQTTPNISKQARLNYLNAMHNWKAEGRVSIQQQTQTQTASYKWQQKSENYQAYFYSPFSSDSLTISGNATTMRIDESHGMTKDEIELEQSLPFVQLGYWAKGIPAPGSTPQVAIYDSYNQLQTLQQDGWQVEYQCYKDTSPISLPEKITMRRDDTKVKLLISRWQK